MGNLLMPPVYESKDYPGHTTFYGHALWYAWGRKDEKEFVPDSATDPYAFAHEYDLHARSSFTTPHMRESIQDAFNKWAEGEPIYRGRKT